MHFLLANSQSYTFTCNSVFKCTIIMHLCT